MLILVSPNKNSTKLCIPADKSGVPVFDIILLPADRCCSVYVVPEHSLIKEKRLLVVVIFCLITENRLLKNRMFSI